MQPRKSGNYPTDDRPVLFTDLMGIERKGIYRKSRNGYTETSEVEVSEKNEYVYPEEEIMSWKYADS